MESSRVMAAMAIEGSFILVSFLLLVQPRPLFNVETPRLKNVYTLLGLIFLCLTFCWSFLLGSLVFFQRLNQSYSL